MNGGFSDPYLPFSRHFQQNIGRQLHLTGGILTDVVHRHVPTAAQLPQEGAKLSCGNGPL